MLSSRRAEQPSSFSSLVDVSDRIYRMITTEWSRETIKKLPAHKMKKWDWQAGRGAWMKAHDLEGDHIEGKASQEIMLLTFKAGLPRLAVAAWVEPGLLIHIFSPYSPATVEDFILIDHQEVQSLRQNGEAPSSEILALLESNLQELLATLVMALNLD